MPIFKTLNHLASRRIIPALAAWLLAPSAPTTLHAANIQQGNVTTALGPTFFLDEATNGGVDTDLNQPNSVGLLRSFNGLLTPNQGPTRVVLTGFGFALHTSATANDATSVAVAFTYLGADEAVGGSDDVAIGTSTGSLTFTIGGEYVFAFDTPLTANLNITGTRFRIVITPSNGTADGSLKIKSLNPGSWPYEPYVSVAGVASSTIIPQRVNLAKYQTVTASSVNGNRLASYATDGDAGNDSYWQSQSWAYNNARIDFPFPVEVGSAQVSMGVNDTLPLAQFGIQYLVGTTWTTIPVTDISGNTNVERKFVFPSSITASSFRIIVTDPVIRLREFALYPPNGPDGYPLGTDVNVNLALQRPAVASSFVAGSFPINAVDGRTHAGSSWQTTTAGLNTLDIDMVSSTKIGSVHLYSGSSTVSALGDFALKSWNGTAWVDIPGGIVTGNTALDRVVTFTTPPTTSRVRLEFTKTGTTPTVIRELQIFPANTGNVGYALGTGINPSGSYADYEAFSDAFYQITNVAANRDIAVATGGQPALESAGITVAQTQYQVLLNLSDGTYRLRNRDTGECLSGAQLSKTPGAALTDEPYLALPHQDWILEPLGGGPYRITNAWSGLAIDTQGGATAQGTALVQNTASNATSQQWRFNYNTWAPKKGLGHGSFGAAFNANWLYRWGPDRPANLPEEVVFHPMQWGSFNWTYNTGSGPIWQRNSEWRKSGDGIMMMGFNEPDRTDQSNIPVADAVNLWPQLMALNQPLVGPSPADDGTWLTAFTNDAKNRGFRWDYTATHAYPGPGGNSDGLINDIQSKSNTFGLPVWLTEFSFVDWGGNQSWSEEDCYQTLAEFLWRAEGLTALRKYALFVFTADANNPQPANSYTNYTPAPRSNSYDTSGNLTAFGKLYAGWDGDATVRPDKAYHIHNRALCKRMANAATGNANPGGRTIRTDGPIVEWTLVSTGVTNRYYIVSSNDGRRLSHTSGNGTPTFAAASTTGANVEWSLTHNQHGWYYIGHPASNLRLRLASFNTSNNVASYQMVAATTTDENTQWRFIVPLPANTGPTIASIPDQVVNELTPLTFTVNATDSHVPPLPLIYSIINPPFNSSINATTGEFRWTPTETQGNGTTYAITIRVGDGQLSAERIVNITANEVNLAPALATIPAQNVNEGSLLTFTATATDADIPANTLTYSLIGAPAGAAIVGGSGVFTWTPTEAQGPGSFTFTVRVSDGGLTHDRSVTVTVNEANLAPVLATIPAQTVNEAALLTFTASATDADLPANTLTYSLIGAPVGASIIASTGVFTWTPTESQGPGSPSFTVRVSDGNLTHDRLVNVTVNEVSTAPVLAVIPAQTVSEGMPLTFTASATDADLPANTLTYSLIGAPVGASIIASTGVFTWTPTESQGPGNPSFTVRVSDGNLTHDRLVNVTVNEVSTAPVLAVIPAQTVSEGVLLTFTAAATDADLPANTLTYSLINAPVGASIVASTGVFTWTPTESQGPDGFNFTVRVSDGNLTHDQPVSVTVNEVSTAPVLATIPLQTVNKEDLLTFTASATDADLPANTLTFSLVGAPVGALIDSVTGIFAWTPTGTQGPGSFNFSVSVSDGSLTHDQPVSVTVNPPNVAPVLAAIPPQTVNESTLLTFTASATDADLPANILTYSLVGAPVGASITPATGVFNWTPTEVQGPGMFNFTVRVNDGYLNHDQPVTVTVTDDGGADHLGTWIVAGQSNAEGYGITESPINGLAPASTLATIGRGDLNVTHTGIQMFQGANDNNGIPTSAGSSLPPRDTWHAMTSYEGLAYDWGSGRGNESRRRFGPELAFGYDVQRQLGSSIALIKYARGSCSIAPSIAQSGGVWRDFDPSDGGRLNQYDKLISTIQAAVNNLPAGQVLKMRGVVWMQGESDATATNAPSYQANLTELIAALRADIGNIAAASGGKMTRSAASWSELDVFVGTVQNTNASRQTVINAQNAVADADANVFTVNGTTGLSMMTFDDWGDSGVHYDTAGQVLLGERFADAAISRIDSGVQISESGGATNVAEGGATDTYTVTLTRAPSADVTISITTDPQVTVSPTSLTFTAGNWGSPQTVTVTAVNDTVIESNHSGSISHDLSSSDLSFGGLPINGVTAAVIDNDANTAPVLAAIPPQTGNKGTLLTFTASATDADLPADTLTYSLAGAPVGASIDANTAVFTWTPSESQAPGSFNFTVQVSDGNLTHDQPVLVTVESPLPSPNVDTDGDGLSDLLEYAFLSNPGIPNGSPFRVVAASAGTISLEFPWNWQVAGLSWQIRHGHDLSNIAAWPVVAPGATTTIREGDIDRITVAPAMAHPDRGFYVLEVIGN